jgi:hypothetical protein
MKTSLLRKLLAVGLVGLMMVSSGCRGGLTTSLVWRINVYHPAPVPRVSLAVTPNKDDVLVEYDECFAKSRDVRVRAYWLFKYAAVDTNAMERPKPAFVPLDTFTNFCSIPVVCSTNAISPLGYSVQSKMDSAAFTLWRNGALVGEYHLPVYSNAPPVTWGRVALTPLSVTTDAAIIAAILICIGASGGGGGAR